MPHVTDLFGNDVCSDMSIYAHGTPRIIAECGALTLLRCYDVIKMIFHIRNIPSWAISKHTETVDIVPKVS